MMLFFKKILSLQQKILQIKWASKEIDNQQSGCGKTRKQVCFCAKDKKNFSQKVKKIKQIFKFIDN